MSYKKISNILYGISMLYAVLVLGKVLIDNSRLPEGVCPTSFNSPYIYSAIVLLLTTLVITTILDRKAKRKDNPRG